MDLRAVFRRYGRDPDRPIGCSDPIPDLLIRNMARIDGPAPGEPRPQSRGAVLTDQQAEVLRYRSHGLDLHHAAEAMGISYETARGHSKAAIRRLAAKNSTHAVAIAIRQGVIL